MPVSGPAGLVDAMVDERDGREGVERLLIAWHLFSGLARGSPRSPTFKVSA